MGPDYENLFDQALQSVRDEGRYRHFADLERIAGEFPNAICRMPDGTEKRVTVWCSNDYLGMGQHPVVRAAMHAAIDRYGVGAGGTRNIAGTNHEIVELERTLAQLHGKPAALAFGSGYIANEATLSTIGHMLPEAVFVSDEANHASMIAGMRHCKAAGKHIFKHNDVADMREALNALPKSTPKIVAAESVYSMDGDIAPLAEMAKWVHEYNGLFFVDEVHAVGMYGSRGGGVGQELGIEDEIDVVTGTLGKAFGVIGGYVSSSTAFCDVIRSYAPAFIFTTAIPPHVAAGADASVAYLMHSRAERDAMKTNVAYLRQALGREGVAFVDADSHITPIIVGEARRCKEVTDRLLNDFDMYVQPINYPTVPKGTERLRVTVSPAHTPAMVDEFAAAVATILA